MKAVVFNQFGDPEVLEVIDLPVPEPGPGQVRVQNRAAGTQPFDALFRSGQVRMPAHFPQQLGNEFAGVVDAVGANVTTFQVGDEVLGWSSFNAYAEFLLADVTNMVRKPADLPWAEAAVFSASGQTAQTALEALRVQEGDTLLIHAAAGGVGHFAVQLARARGARVIGTASPRNHDFLRELGAEPVAYGPGLLERVQQLAPAGIDAALIAVGTEEAFQVSAMLVLNKTRVGSTVFHPLVDKFGFQQISTQRTLAHLQELLDLHTKHQLNKSFQGGDES